MEAPRIEQGTKWFGILRDFSNGTIPADKAEETFEKMAKHIPAIFQEITLQPQSYQNLRAVLEKYSSIKQTPGYQAVVKTLATIRPDLIPLVFGIQTPSETTVHPLDCAEEDVLNSADKEISNIEFWKNLDLSKVSLNSVDLLKVLFKNINSIGGLIINHTRFQNEIKVLLQKLNDEKFSKIMLGDMYQEQKPFALAYLRFSSNVYKLNPQLIPTDIQELLHTKKTVRFSDGEASVKNYQLKLFHSLISNRVHSPSRLDMVKTMMTAALFTKMLDIFFTKAPGKMDLSVTELVDIYEFITGIIGSEPNDFLTLVQAFLNNHFVQMKTTHRLLEKENLEALKRLKVIGENNALIKHMYDINLGETQNAILTLNPSTSGHLLRALVFSEQVDLIDAAQYQLENISWGNINLTLAELQSYIECSKAIFKIADLEKQSRNYLAVKLLIEYSLKVVPALQQSFLQEIEKAFPEIVKYKSLDDDFVDVQCEKPKNNLFLELDLVSLNDNLQLDSLNFLSHLNISKVRFLKPTAVTIKFSQGFAGKVEYAQQLSYTEKLGLTISSMIRR